MSEVKNYGLSGIAGNVELGKGGPRFKNNATVIEMRNAADNAFAVVAGAEPTAADHFATKAYVDRLASVAIKGQMINDVARLPDDSGVLVPATGDVIIVTTVGATWDTLKRLLKYNGAAWEYLFTAGEPEGLRISITDATSGGTDTYLADHVYMWDADGSVWVDVGPALGATNVQYGYTQALAFGSGASVTVRANAVGRAVRVKVAVTTAFDGTNPTLQIGDAGDSDRLMTTGEVNLKVIGLYVSECFYDYTVATNIVAAYAADSSAAGAASITVELIN
jgi:hypothetical protein